MTPPEDASVYNTVVEYAVQHDGKLLRSPLVTRHTVEAELERAPEGAFLVTRSVTTSPWRVVPVTRCGRCQRVARHRVTDAASVVHVLCAWCTNDLVELSAGPVTIEKLKKLEASSA